tara:strand:- start:2261 stop:3340 length:1080 start_codon:yes stop_codon:yes gene_type:complete
MAYNVLKGIVEGSVDQYGDQEIDGVKVFKSTISASVFYDTDARSPCATMKDVAITQLEGETKKALLTLQEDTVARAEQNLTFDGEVLTTKNVRAERFIGDGAQLVNLPADQFKGKISAASLNLGNSLHNNESELEVNVGGGLTAGATGLSIAAAAHGGLGLLRGQLSINPNNCLHVTHGGQNLTDKDTLLVYDASRGALYNTTLENLYSSYIHSKIPHAAGKRYSVQLKGARGFEASDKFTFDVGRGIMQIEGKVSADSLDIAGAVTHNITTVTSSKYKVNDSDYTVLVNSETDCAVTLPATNEGRVVIIKKINSNLLTIDTNTGKIDSHENIKVKNTNSVRILQYDGKNWWLIGKTGT